MVSQKNHASAEENFGKQTKRKVGYDLPKDLEPWRRFAYELGDLSDWSISTSSSSDSSSSSETLGLVYSSKYKDLMFRSRGNTALQSVSSKGVERKDVPQALVTPNPNPIDIVKKPDDKASESHVEVVPVSPPKGYKRRKGVTVVRDFPLAPNPKTVDNMKNSDDKASESPLKVVLVSPPKGYKPRKGVTAVRDFPVPQRNFQTRFSEDSLQAVVPDGFRYFYKSRNGITVVRDFAFPRFQTPSSEVLVQAVAAESSPSYDSESEKELESVDSSPSYDSEFKYELESTKSEEEEEEEVTSKYEDKESTKEAELGLTDMWYDLVQSGDSIMSTYRLTSEEEEEIDISKGMDFMESEDQLSETSKHDSTDLTGYVATPNDSTSFELDSEGYSRISCKKGPNFVRKKIYL